jgi:hypothetical protein
VMKIFWKTWTKMTFWFFKWLAMMASNTNDLFNSHEMEEEGGSICEPNYWCFECFGYNVSHTNIIQNFDKFYIGGIW